MKLNIQVKTENEVDIRLMIIEKLLFQTPDDMERLERALKAIIREVREKFGYDALYVIEDSSINLEVRNFQYYGN